MHSHRQKELIFIAGLFLSICFIGSSQCTVANCAQCRSSSNTRCRTCQTGFYLRSSLCVACPTGCSSCTQPSLNSQTPTCTACSSGYTLSSPNCVLISCPSTCTNCVTGANGTSCTSCANYYYVSNGSCLSCPSNCLTCSAPTSSYSSNCLTCASNYILSSTSSGNECLLSVSSSFCSQNCVDCRQLSTNNYICFNTSCGNGCNNCQTGTTSSSCSSCSNGFYLSSNTCATCPSNCLTCVAPASTYTSNCSTCASNYILTISSSGNQCFLSVTSSLCSSLCTDCRKSNSGTYSCYLYTCVSSCVTCNKGSIAGVCSSCSNGYYVDSLSSCSVCPSNCLTCSAPTSSYSSNCLTCASNYLLSSTSSGNQCLLSVSSSFCSQNCIDCRQLLTNNYICFNTSCGDYCTSCQYGTSSSTCLECSNGYYVYNINSCASCPSNCYTCQLISSLPSCTSCSSSSYLLSNVQSRYDCFLAVDSSYCTGVSCVDCRQATNSSYICYQVAASSQSQSSSSISVGVIVGAVIGGVVAIVIGVIIIRKCCMSAAGGQAGAAAAGADGAGSEIALRPGQQPVRQRGFFDFFRRENQFQKWKAGRQSQFRKCSDTTCSICLDPKAEITTNCGHQYHSECLRGWLRRKKTCPLCVSKNIEPLKIFCTKCSVKYLELDVKNYFDNKERISALCLQCIRQVRYELAG